MPQPPSTGRFFPPLLPMDSLRTFALAVLSQIKNDLTAQNSMNYSGIDQQKSEVLLSALQGTSQDYASKLSELCSLSYTSMKDTCHEPSPNFAWRRLYTDAALVWALLDCLGACESDITENEDYWKQIVTRLDNSIVIAGAPDDGRLELVLVCIAQLQTAFLPFRPLPVDKSIPIPAGEAHRGLLPSASLPVPVLSSPPTMLAFSETRSDAPFILKAFANDWPAVSGRKWASESYLNRVAGRGRVVPVEVGRDYRLDTWSQRMMGWDEFLDYVFFDADSNRQTEEVKFREGEVVYLAQHNIFNQFPALREDVIVPDYIYAVPPKGYVPPGNDDALVLNAWFGPQGTLSPAHTDPFYNFYTQVVGRKTIWLAPPSVSNILSPRSAVSNADSTASSLPSTYHRHSSSDFSSESDAQLDPTSTLSNTSHLDVFASASDLDNESAFTNSVIPVAMSAVLDEGDMLFFPPGWWHAMRSETTSFSVSMWF